MERKVNELTREQLLKGKPEGFSEARIELVQPARTGSIRIRSYTEIVNDEPVFRCYRDVNTGEPQMINIHQTIRLDLSKDEDWLQFNHIKNHPFVKNKKYVNCIDTNQKARGNVQIRKLISEASVVISQLSNDRVYDFARIALKASNIKINGTTNPDVIKDLLYERVGEVKGTHNLKFAKEIIDLDKDELFGIKAELIRAIHNNKVLYENGNYNWGGTKLGRTFEDAVESFRTNPEMFVEFKNKA